MTARARNRFRQREMASAVQTVMAASMENARLSGSNLPARSNFESLPVGAVTELAGRRLPKARERDLMNLEQGRIVYPAGTGRFEEGGLVEILLATAGHGSAVEAAVAASLLLQHGCSVDTLRRALTRNSEGSASGPLARALDLFSTRPGCRLTAAQNAAHAALRAAGATVVTSYGLDDALAQLERWQLLRGPTSGVQQ